MLYRFKLFFGQNKVMSLMEQLNNMYKELHQKLIQQLTRREREKEKMFYDQNQLLSEQVQKRQGWNRKEICVPFTFKSGSMLNFKRELCHLWKKYYIYDGSPMNEYNTTNNKCLNQLLVKKKPPRSILLNKNATTTK